MHGSDYRISSLDAASSRAGKSSPNDAVRDGASRFPPTPPAPPLPLGDSALPPAGTNRSRTDCCCRRLAVLSWRRRLRRWSTDPSSSPFSLVARVTLCGAWLQLDDESEAQGVCVFPTSSSPTGFVLKLTQVDMLDCRFLVPLPDFSCVASVWMPFLSLLINRGLYSPF